MSLHIIAGSVLTFIFSWACFHFAIPLSYYLKLVDIPTSRRKHSKPTPIIGGLCIFLSWGFGILTFGLLEPSWIIANSVSLITISVGLSLLIGLGVVDDVHGLGPAPKLTIEFIAAGLVLAFEPNVHAICVIWSEKLGFFIWILAAIWTVGISNAINLIDGLDGLAGGTSLFVATSLLIMSIWAGPEAFTSTILMAFLIPTLLIFLKFNWSPAKTFLGDNGSLPLGFLLANASLMCRPQNKSWIMIVSLILMLWYPLLDTSLAILRRLQKRLPLFKADRNHLHYRILRLGLTTSQTSALLLSITLYTQVAALCINLMSPAAATLGITMVIFSIFTLIFTIRGIEQWRVNRLFKSFKKSQNQNLDEPLQKQYSVLTIDLEPLLEAGMSEEKGRYRQLINALELMVKTCLREDDYLLTSSHKFSILLSQYAKESEQAETELIGRVKSKLEIFLSLYNLQCSLSNFPIEIEHKSLLSALPRQLRLRAASTEAKKKAA